MNLKFQKRHQAGFSLIEIMIAVGLLSLISLGFMSMMDNVVRFQRGAQAKDQQKEVSSEIRAFLSNPTACLNSLTAPPIVGGILPVANFTSPNGVAYTQLRDGTAFPGVVQYSPGTLDRTGLLAFKRFWLESYQTSSDSAILHVIMTKTGIAGGSAEIKDTVFLHIRRDGSGNVNYCVALGKQEDSFWKMTPGNSADISFGVPFAGRVGIGTNAPPTKLAVNGDGIFTSSLAVNTSTPAVVGTQAFIVTGNSMLLGNLAVNTTTPATTSQLEVIGNTTLWAGGAQILAIRALSAFPNDPGDFVFQNSNATERARIHSGQTATGEIRFSTTGTERMTILGGANLRVGIGTTNPQEELHVAGDVQADTFQLNSDARLKRDVEKAPGIEKIRRLTGHTYRWIKDGRLDSGVIAQELETELPYLVKTHEDGMKAVNYIGLVPILIEGTKDLYTEHMKLLKRIEELEKEMKAMKKRRPSSEADLEDEEPSE